MDAGVAVRTSCIKSPGPVHKNAAALIVPTCIDTVPFMALEAQKRFPLVEKPFVYRTVRTVAVETVLSHIRMFIKEWTSFLSMALDTGLFDAVLKKILACNSSVGIMAVNTEHPPLLEGMMAWHGKLGLGSLMAVETKLARGKRGDFQIWTGVNIMAVKTGNFVDCMVPRVPVMQVEGGIGSVALEADEGLGRGGEVF